MAAPGGWWQLERSCGGGKSVKGTLAAVCDRRASRDIISNGPAVGTGSAPEEEGYWAKRAREESGPVKTMLDLTEFIRFSQSAPRGGFIKVSSSDITISHGIGKNYEPGAMVELLLNKKGTILVMRETQKGMPLRLAGPKSSAKRVSCRELINTLKALGVELPVRFYAEWDEELKAWVGRR